MQHLSSDPSTTTHRRGVKRGLLVGLITLAATTALPAGSAFAGKPVTGFPTKPVAVADVSGSPVTISGQVQMSNACAGVYCHSYLSLMRLQGSKYKVFSWKDISALTPPFTISATAATGKYKYRTALEDYVTISTPGTCGASSMKFYGTTYQRNTCADGLTTYLKIYQSPSVWITAPMPLPESS